MSSNDLRELNTQLCLCTGCPLAEGRTQVVTGEGTHEARVMFVGHGPSGTDDETGRPYTGPGGLLLDELFNQAGIKREELWLTNLTKCWTWKLEYNRRVNHTPSIKNMNTCTKLWLARELELVRPRALVCIGGPTAQYFLGRTFKVSEQSGQWFEFPVAALEKIGAQLDNPPAVIALEQPAALIHLGLHAPERAPLVRAQMLRTLALIKRVMEGEEPELSKSEH